MTDRFRIICITLLAVLAIGQAGRLPPVQDFAPPPGQKIDAATLKSIRDKTDRLGKAINLRFFTSEAGVKKGAATPERDNYLALAVSPRYKHNLARYLLVVRNIALRENPVQRTERLQPLQKKLLEPASSALASLQLEAIGQDAAPALKEGLRSNDAEVRFYSAEALAYLDHD